MALSFKKPALACCLLAAFGLQVRQAEALSLVEAYESALANDPTYQAALHENEAGQQNRVLGRSFLLPSIGASYAHYNNRADVTQPNIVGALTTSHPEYSSVSSSVTLRQPLFSLDAYARYKQGIAQSEYADAVLSSRGQDLLQRLVSAYSDAKFAEDQLTLVTAQRDTYAEQRRVNERMFQKGEGTKTDMLETQARYDLAEAQVLESRNNLAAARNALEAIVGVDVKELDQLRDDFQVKILQPASFEDWKAAALERNPDLIAQRQAVESARQEIAKQRAGHTPRVDFVASYSKGTSETLTTLNQDSTNRTIGVQVNIPIYSGGSVSASTAQATANHERAKSELEAKTRQMTVELRKQYDAVISGAARIEAAVKTVNSAELLVHATEQSVKGGVRINLDVLNAQQQYYSARRDLAQARYNYIMAYLRLHAAAGMLTQEVLHDVASYFRPGASGLAMRQPIARAAMAASSVPEEATNPAPEHEKLLAAVAAWTRAWSARDVDTYLERYARDFDPEKGMSRAAWLAERRSRIAGKKSISVRVESPEVAVNGDVATVKFVQVYEADGKNDRTLKILELARKDGDWKIRRERVSG